MSYALSLAFLGAFIVWAWRQRIPVHEFNPYVMSVEWRKANWR